MLRTGEKVVLDRRLRVLYDSIDGGNNKKAVQEADKVLRKHPTIQSAKALKALALIRIDRLDEAWPLIDQVQKDLDEPDEHTIQALTQCFKETYVPERISALYEHLCAKFPKSEQYLIQLFMSYVRTRNFANQQRTALKLNKIFPKKIYNIWNITSIILQGTTADSVLAESVYYPLAEKMLRKIVETDSVSSFTIGNLYLMVLERSKQYEKAAQFLEFNPIQKSAEYTTPQFIDNHICNLYFLAENFVAVIQKCINQLKKNGDEWELWKCFLTATIKQYKKLEDDDAERENLIGKALMVMKSSVDEQVNNCAKDRVRGPYLARLFFRRILIEENIIGDEIVQSALSAMKDDPLEHLVEYVQLFSSKPCCFLDIQTHLDLLDDRKMVFLTRIQELISAEKSDNKCLEMETIFRSVEFAFDRFKDLTVDEKRQQAASIVAWVYKHVKDEPLVKACVYVAVHLLWSIYVEAADRVALYEILLIMKLMIKLEPSDATPRIISCHVCALLGIVDEVDRETRWLDIKYVQKDTLGYLSFGLNELYGRFKAGILYYTDLSIFFDQSERELSESVVACYRNENFVSIPRFVKFLSSIDHSMHGIGADVYNRHLSACFAVEKIEHLINTMNGDEENIDFTTLSDNRDLSTIPSFHPESWRKLEEIQKISFIEQVDAIKMRHLILRSIAAIYIKKRSSMQLNERLEQLLQHAEHCTKYKEEEVLNSELYVPFATYLHEFIIGKHLDLIIFLLKSAADVLKTVENSSETENENKIITEDDLLGIMPEASAFENLLKANCCIEPESRLLMQGESIRKCSLALQTLALCSVILKLFRVSIDESFTTSGRRMKKERQRFPKYFSELRKLFDDHLKILDSWLLDCNVHLEKDQEVINFGAIFDKDLSDILHNEAKETVCTIISSYRTSLNEMRGNIQRLLLSQWR